MKKQDGWKWVMAAGLALAVGFGVSTYLRTNDYETRLNQVYEGAVLSALRQTEDVQLSMSKALLSSDPQVCAQYLSEVKYGAGQISQSLSLLPFMQQDGQKAVKLANQLSDYAGVLIAAGEITEEDARQMNALIDACAQYTSALPGAPKNVAATAAPRDENYQAYDASVSYPTLIYDGPFSDARKTESWKGLGGREITREDAVRLAREFVGEERVVSVSEGADTGGEVPCYGVTVQLQDLTLEAAVTRLGGKILFLFPDTASFSSQQSVEACRENAIAFLRDKGFEEMEATYFQVYEGVCVISFAATQGNTLLYPDLVKVQLRMDTGEVVGLEQRNYLQNHTARGALRPQLSQEEAQGAVSERLKIESARLCLIPTESGEKLCYEFKGEYAGSVYLAYIDAENGEQRELFKVVETPTGLEAA